MKRLLTTTRFKRDLKRARKRGRPLNRLEDILTALLEAHPLYRIVAVRTACPATGMGPGNATLPPTGC
jgi:hypothetical protein